jgi:membrane protein implicated in regulation of membrane protease activity
MGRPGARIADMNSNKMPGWLVVLLSVLGVAILGPPALVLVFLVLGVALSVGVALLKVSLVALGVAAIVFVLRAMFGSKSPSRLPAASSGVESIDAIAARLEAEEAERRHELDRQLAEMQSART